MMTALIFVGVVLLVYVLGTIIKRDKAVLDALDAKHDAENRAELRRLEEEEALGEERRKRAAEIIRRGMNTNLCNQLYAGGSGLSRCAREKGHGGECERFTTPAGGAA